MFILKKHIEEDREYISPEDIFETRNEFDTEVQNAFFFLSLLEKELNYFNHNTSTAFGNPDLAFYKGQVSGYILAKGWERKDVDGEVIIRKGRRILFKIEKPALSFMEKENRKELAALNKYLGL